MAVAVKPTEERKVEARFEALVLDFLAYLEFERGLARNTLDAYRTDLLQFGVFLAGRGRGATEVERADVADFLADLATGKPASNGGTLARRAHPRRSAARRPACARSTGIFAARSWSISIPRRRSSRPLEPEAPASAEPRRGHQAARQREGSEPIDLRDRALLELMYGCGLRASERSAWSSRTST